MNANLEEIKSDESSPEMKIKQMVEDQQEKMNKVR